MTASEVTSGSRPRAVGGNDAEAASLIPLFDIEQAAAFLHVSKRWLAVQPSAGRRDRVRTARQAPPL